MARKLSIVDKSDAEFEIKRNGVEWIDVFENSYDENTYFQLCNDYDKEEVCVKTENFHFVVEAAKELNIDIDVWED